MTKAYLDTNISSGLSRQKLWPPHELRASNVLKAAADRGEISLIYSNEAQREEERTNNPATRALLDEGRLKFPRAKHDHKVLGGQHGPDGFGGYASQVLVTDVVDPDLLARLRSVGLKERDALHTTYAVAEGCSWLLTVDDKDFLPYKPQVEALCPSLKLVRPTELVAELGL